jgi:hypothetical protein
VYIVVRTDLPLHQQIIQAAHAATEAAQYFAPVPPETPDNIVLLSVPDETALVAMADRLKGDDIKCRLIREPDLSNAATALSTEPLGGKRRQSWLRQATMWGRKAPEALPAAPGPQKAPLAGLVR